ncbi:hypothetical protein B0J11DRAFT_493408 [Dendryphion nanum]|uniref:Uncharacterized protein n=1 Tax=Dendryphion nanum TaxID=256645 RepID=A0A9P9DEC0_9PLEO|nr:hypothetical protein B0J11DRAFT_493408 [Dendryphion nanum]
MVPRKNVAALTFLPADKHHTPPKENPLWLPYTLRLPFLLGLVAASLLLCALVCALCWTNITHHGIGKDDMTSGMLLGWRFVPTVIAVFYAQMLIMVFNDIRTTEPYARMSEPGGALAPFTVLYSPKFVWTTLIQGISRMRNGGKVNWTLTCSSLAYIFAVFAISPLSSSFLTSEDVAVPRETMFTRTVPALSPLPLVMDSATFLRTTNSLIQNLSASAWVSDSYMVLPFAPIDQVDGLSLSSISGSKPGTWSAVSRVFGNDYACEEMEVSTFDVANLTFNAPTRSGGRINGTAEMVSFNLKSPGGCAYSIVVESNQIPFMAQWASWFSDWTSVLAIKSPGARNPNIPESIIITENTRRRTLICSASYYMADIPVTMTVSKGISNFNFSNEEYVQKRKVMTSDVLDTTKLNKMLEESQWTGYIGDVMTKGLPIVADHAALPLVAMGKYNFTNLLRDKELGAKIALVRRRLFGEVLQTSLLQPGASKLEVITGKTTFVERRVVVVKGVGVAIAVFLFLCFLLLIVLSFATRLKSRPLNLRCDPSTVIGVMNAINLNKRSPARWNTWFATSKQQLTTSIKDRRYYINSSEFKEITGTTSTSTSTQGSRLLRRWWTGLKRTESGYKFNSDWRPRVLRLRILLTFVGLLIAFLLAVTILYSFAGREQLHQRLFVFETNLKFLNGPLSTFAPFSILPTLFAVGIGVWWDALDQVFRSLQPYISMAQLSGTTVSQGPNLTYQYSYWVYAAAKAVKNKHWVLFLVTLGSTLCQLLTISTSALFERGPGNNVRPVPLNRTFELRQVPQVTEERMLPGDPMNLLNGGFINTILEYFPPSVYLAYEQNWMHGALNQLTINGSHPVWSGDSWNFVPVDISKIGEAKEMQGLKFPDANDKVTTLFSTQNITVSTPAIRTRLECSRIPAIDNTSSWLQEYDLTNSRIWDVYVNPVGFDKGYKFPYQSHFNPNAAGTQPIFADTPWNTSMVLDTNEALCCNDNTTAKEFAVQNITVGYWSPIDTKFYPHPFKAWPVNFTIKWITGPARSDVFLRKTNLTSVNGFSEEEKAGKGVLLFTEPPSIQALTCRPAIETAPAAVTVDSMGRVLSYELSENPQRVQSPWSDTMIAHDLSKGEKPTKDPRYIIQNVTTSYGIYFMSSLLSAAEVKNGATYTLQNHKEGLDFDFMSQAVYALANKSSRVLLNETLLASLSEHTFQTFFQHFVGRNISFSGQSMAYQKIGAQLPSDLGERIVWNASEAYKARIRELPSYPVLDTNRTVVAQVSTKIEVLRMNDVATWLTAAILIWLVATTVVIAVLQRRFLRPLIRNVECLADVIVLFAGSERFLEEMRERGYDGIVGDGEMRVRLGWFKTSRGEVRWGVEVANGVEWVESVKG